MWLIVAKEKQEKKIVVQEKTTAKGKTIRFVPILTIQVSETYELRVECTNMGKKPGLSHRVFKVKETEWEAAHGRTAYIGPTADGFFLPDDLVSEYLLQMSNSMGLIEKAIEALQNPKE